MIRKLELELQNTLLRNTPSRIRKSILPLLLSSWIVLSLNWGVAAAAVEAAQGNVASFDPNASSIWQVPFPSDSFSVFDVQMASRQRISLPLPENPDLVSELEDVEFVNELDGFSIWPRITIPLEGAVPDPATFNTQTVFLLGLTGPHRGQPVAIDQLVIDDSVPGAPRLIFAADGYLAPRNRYAVVVTTGLADDEGQRFQGNDLFRSFMLRMWLGMPALDSYETELRDAVSVLSATGIVSPFDIATLTVFTTRTVADVNLKLMDRLESGEVPIFPPSFNVDGVPGLEVFSRDEIISIDSYLHRASVIFDGDPFVSFPDDTLRVPETELELTDDVHDEIYLSNVRTRENLRVPAAAIDLDTGALHWVDVSPLELVPGDELAVLVRKVRISPTQQPYLWEGVGMVAYGATDGVPRYTDEEGIIPVGPTSRDFVPSQTGTDRVLFVIYVPATPRPPGGWPVAHFLHGGAENKGGFMDLGTLNTASVITSRGVATVGMTAREFGGGKESYVRVETTTSTHIIRGTGRGLDLDGDGYYQRSTIYSYPQRISDISTILRSIQAGADLDGDEIPDFAQEPERTSIAGISYGGATAFVMSTLEPKASTFVSNVPAGMGSRGRSNGFYPVVPNGGRSFGAQMLGDRTPSLLNGPSPLWGGEFDEAIPLKGEDVQLGLVEGAEAIQRAMDFFLWRDLGHMPVAYSRYIASGELRGGPATHMIQVSRGDGAAMNPMQAMMIRAGGIEHQTAVIRADNEPAFDAQWGEHVPPDVARHLLLWLPYSGNPTLDIGGRICNFTRYQVAEFLATGTVVDPDGDGEIFAGDVFQFPIPPEVLQDMLLDPALPEPLP